MSNVWEFSPIKHDPTDCIRLERVRARTRTLNCAHKECFAYSAYVLRLLNRPMSGFEENRWDFKNILNTGTLCLKTWNVYSGKPLEIQIVPPSTVFWNTFIRNRMKRNDTEYLSQKKKTQQTIVEKNFYTKYYYWRTLLKSYSDGCFP